MLYLVIQCTFAHPTATSTQLSLKYVTLVFTVRPYAYIGRTAKNLNTDIKPDRVTIFLNLILVKNLYEN